MIPENLLLFFTTSALQLTSDISWPGAAGLDQQKQNWILASINHKIIVFTTILLRVRVEIDTNSDLERARGLWKSLCTTLTFVFGLFFVAKVYQNVASIPWALSEAGLGLIIFFWFRSRVLTSLSDLRKWTLFLLLLLYADATVIPLFYPAYFLEKMCWMVAISTIATLFLLRFNIILVSLICYLTVFGLMFINKGIPLDKIMELGKFNQLLNYLLIAYFFDTVAKFLLAEFSEVKAKVSFNLRRLHAEWRHRRTQENLKTVSEAMVLLRHEINNPGAIVSLSLQILKKDKVQTDSIAELDFIVGDIQKVLTKIESSNQEENSQFTAAKFQEEIQALNAAAEERWKYLFFLFFQPVGAVVTLSIAAYAVVHYSSDLFSLSNEFIFATLSLVSAYWTYKTKSPEKSVLLYGAALYFQLLTPLMAMGGLFSNSIIFLAFGPYFFQLGVGGKIPRYFIWMTVACLLLYFFFGHAEVTYSGNAFIRMVNFTAAFIVAMVPALAFEQKRQSILLALNKLGQRFSYIEVGAKSLEDQKLFQELVFKTLSQIQPRLSRAKEISSDLTQTYGNPIVIHIDKSIDRIKVFSDSILGDNSGAGLEPGTQPLNS